MWLRASRRSDLYVPNAIDAGETLDLLEAEKPTMTDGFVAGITLPSRQPRRDLSSMRRGNLYPIMAPAPACRTNRAGARVDRTRPR